MIFDMALHSHSAEPRGVGIPISSSILATVGVPTGVHPVVSLPVVTSWYISLTIRLVSGSGMRVYPFSPLSFCLIHPYGVILPMYFPCIADVKRPFCIRRLIVRYSIRLRSRPKSIHSSSDSWLRS